MSKLKNYWKFRGIPGPPTTYILGNLHEHLNIKRVNVLQLKDWTKKYGKLYGMLEGERKMLITTDLDLLYEVFVKKSDIFHGRRLTPLLGNVDDYSNFLVNVFNARGNRWKRLRTLANPIFNVVTLKTILPTVQDSVNECLKYIEEKEGKPINAYPFFQEFTIDVISRIALGQTSSAYFNNEYLDIVRDVFEKRRETFGELLGFIFPFFVPILKSVAFYFQLSTAKYFTKAYGKLNKAVRERKMLRESASALKDMEFLDEKQRIDFIDLFLDLETSNIKEENAQPFDKTKIKIEKKLSTYEVVAMCFVFLLAGYDTTATSIGYFVYLLAKNPEAQKKIQEEIDSICPNHEPTYEDLQKFKYLEAAIKESLRLYPLAARAASRQCMETTTINGLKIEKDVYVTADVFTIHYSKEIWGKDSEEFKPERFLNIDEKRHPMSWLPFGAGPRICLGMRLAYMEEKAFIIGLLKKFNIQKTANTPENLQLFGALVVAPESVDVKFVQRF
uniref:Cytochrome P450 n=1 Tax=Panagrolaimus davidi TaxID=227884 RepID=A0A914QB31_9BILA